MPPSTPTSYADADAVRPPERSGSSGGALDRYFEITQRGSTVAREIRGGFTTFVTMAYIVVLNPLIIGLAADADGRVLGVPQVAAATALVAGVLTILMGVVGRFPLALAAGLGLNAFVAFGIATQMSWADAMGLVVLEGLIITALVLTGFRVAVFNAVPQHLKAAITAGIGLFIALIGFVDAGFIRRTGQGPVPVELGVGGNLAGWPTLVFAVGLFLTLALVVRRVKGGILLGIIGTTVLALVVEALARPGAAFTPPDKINPTGWQLNVPTVPEQIVGLPDLSLLGDFSLLGAFERVGLVAALLLVFTLLLTDFFDTMGTIEGVGTQAGLVDREGRVPRLRSVLLVDSAAAVLGGAGSVSSNTSYIESGTGVADGARTGLASVVTGLLFLLALFLTPLVSLVPFEAAAPALIVVGFLMFSQVRRLDYDDYGVSVPVFLTVALMPFTYSIAVGIGAGFISYAFIRAVQGQARKVHPLLWVVAGLFALYFAISPVRAALGVG